MKLPHIVTAIAAGLFLAVVVFLSNRSDAPRAGKLSIMKDVGEAYMDHFGLSEIDFKNIKDARIDIIEGNFDICADDEDVRYFLDQSERYKLQVIMPAGSGEAEWGYACDTTIYPKEQKPEWNKKAVIAWVEQWKDHPDIYAWDISNEAGSVFPNASIFNEVSSQVPDEYYITETQLKTAYKDVKEADPDRPVMIRMNGWFFYDYDSHFFRPGNPFAPNVADIVMVNAYSNVDDHSPIFVSTVSNRAKQALRAIEPDVKIIVAIGAWEEKPIWLLPGEQQFVNDVSQVNSQADITAIAYFKYGAKDSEWYLPDQKNGAPYLLQTISRINK